MSALTDRSEIAARGVSPRRRRESATRRARRSRCPSPLPRPLHSSLSSVLAAVLATASSLLRPPAPVAGQEAESDALAAVSEPITLGRIVLVLVDGATGAPVSNALVTVDLIDRRTLSDSAGTAVFLDVPPGSHTLRISHIGYAEQSTTVDVQAMQSAIVALTLDAEAVAVEPLEVLIEHRPRRLEIEGFYDRRAEGLGAFFDPLFVERWGVGGWGNRADRFIDLLFDLTPQLSSSVRTTASSGGGGYTSSFGSGFSGQCPAVYVDGRPVFNDVGKGPARELEMMSTYMIGAVEIYPSSQGVPDFALKPEVGCGSVVIWTNRWRGRPRELGGGDVELCAPENPAFTQVEGIIRDEFTDVLLPGAHVLATHHPEGRTRAAEEIEVVADREGRYRLCDIPPDHTLTMRVVAARRSTAEVEVPLTGGLVSRDVRVPVAGPGDVVGRVLDRESGRPVAAATITVHGTPSAARTDAEGYFALSDVLPGDRVVEIAHIGFEPVVEAISIVADRTVDLQVELSADPIALEPLVVTALRDRRLELRGFYERRGWGDRTGSGVFFDREAVERRTPATTSSLLREVPGVEVRCSGSRDCRLISTRGPECAQMSVYVDGSLALGAGRRDPVSIDELVRPGEIAAVEVYPSAASVPAEYTGTTGRCGAVVIWTR